MQRKMIEYQDTPLLRVGSSFTKFNHMLRTADRKTVPLVMEYLFRNGMEVYLGGSAVSEWIFEGNKNYFDVDILGVAGEEKNRLDLVKRFSGFPNIWKIGSREFKIQNITGDFHRYMNKRYMNINLDERIRFDPLIESRLKAYLFLVGMKSFEPSRIDVSLVSKEEFKTIL